MAQIHGRPTDGAQLYEGAPHIALIAGPDFCTFLTLPDLPKTNRQNNRAALVRQVEEMARLSNLAMSKARVAELALTEKEDQIQMLTRRLEQQEAATKAAKEKSEKLERVMESLDPADNKAQLSEYQQEIGELSTKPERNEKLIGSYRDQLAERSKLEGQYQEALEELETKLKRMRLELDATRKETDHLRTVCHSAKKADRGEASSEQTLKETQAALDALTSRNEELASSLKASQETVHALEDVNETLHMQVEQLRKERAEILEKNAKLAQVQHEAEEKRARRPPALEAKRTSLPNRVSGDANALPGITSLTGSPKIAQMASELNRKMDRPAFAAGSDLEAEIAQVAELLEASHRPEPLRYLELHPLQS